MAARVAHDGRISRRRFKKRAIGIGFHRDRAGGMPDLELVELAGPETRHEKFPHTRSPERSHRKIASVPTIEVSHQRNPQRRRRPYREGHAGNPADHPRLRPEFLVDPVLVALVEKIQILRSEGGKETIGIMELPRLAVRVGGTQPVGKDPGSFRNEALEKPLRREQFQLVGRSALALDIDHRARHGIPQQRPNHDALAAAPRMRMHPEDPVRRGMGGVKQSSEIGFGDNHGTIPQCYAPAARRLAANPAPAGTAFTRCFSARPRCR